MPWFRRRTDLASVVATHRGFTSVAVDEPAPPSPDETRARLLRVAAEAVILQDSAEAVLRGIRSRQSFGVLAPHGGPLVHRFFCLRDRLPERCAEADHERLRRVLDLTLHHHAMLVSMALELAAVEWRSERITQQIDAIDGLGTSGRWLQDAYDELASPTRAGLQIEGDRPAYPAR